MLSTTDNNPNNQGINPTVESAHKLSLEDRSKLIDALRVDFLADLGIVIHDDQQVQPEPATPDSDTETVNIEFADLAQRYKKLSPESKRLFLQVASVVLERESPEPEPKINLGGHQVDGSLREYLPDAIFVVGRLVLEQVLTINDKRGFFDESFFTAADVIAQALRDSNAEPGAFYKAQHRTA
jgi:hypothetical protein